MYFALVMVSPDFSFDIMKGEGKSGALHLQLFFTKENGLKMKDEIEQLCVHTKVGVILLRPLEFLNHCKNHLPKNIPTQGW